MSSDTLVVGGITYLSSARAAKLVGYTKDYIGQLARAGKLNAKLIGRSWYVSEDSVRKHKLDTHYTLTKQKKPRKNHDLSNSKKTNKYNDISFEQHKISTASTDSSAGIESHEGSYFSTEPFGSILPPIRKDSTASHVLAQSDFRYEREAPLALDDELAPLVREQSKESTFVAEIGSFDEDPVAIRRESAFNAHVSQNTHSGLSGGVRGSGRAVRAQGVDGVLVESRVRTCREDRQVRRLVPNPRASYDHERVAVREPSAMQGGRRSRSPALSVAAVFFAFFILLYFVFISS